MVDRLPERLFVMRQREARHSMGMMPVGRLCVSG